MDTCLTSGKLEIHRKPFNLIIITIINQEVSN